MMIICITTSVSIDKKLVVKYQLFIFDFERSKYTELFGKYQYLQ